MKKKKDPKETPAQKILDTLRKRLGEVMDTPVVLPSWTR